MIDGRPDFDAVNDFDNGRQSRETVMSLFEIIEVVAVFCRLRWFKQ